MKMMSEIREARLEDAAEILALQKMCYLQEAKTYNDFNIPPLHQTLASTEEEFRNQIVLKITDKQKIIGSVRGEMTGDTCKIAKLMVHPDYQNQGLGKKLMTTIEAKCSPIDRFELFTGYQSHKNLGLYQSLGYEEFDRKKIHENLWLVFLEKFMTNQE